MKFVGVAALAGVSDMESFVNATGVGIFPNIADEAGAVWANYGVRSQPAFVLQRADGSTEMFGSLGESTLQGHIDRLFG